MKNKIINITVRQEVDDNPDTSWMGKYTDECSEYAIIVSSGEFAEDAEGQPERGRKFRYFLAPIDNYEGCTKKEMRKYCMQDFKRMQGLNNGDWCFLGITARAEIQLAGSNIVQTIDSGGLWGIESDCKEAIEGTIQDQLLTLSNELTKLGFSKYAINKAIKQVEVME